MVSSMRFIQFFVLLAQGIFALEGTSISSPSTSSNFQKDIQKKCNFTRYPNLCVETLNMGLGSGYYQHVDIVSAMVNKTLSETKLPNSNFSLFNSQFGAQKAQLANSVADNCEMLMSMSMKRIDQCLTALNQSPNKNKQDIQTWLSAALTFQQACKDSADEISKFPGDIMNQISKKMIYLSQLSSNTLALVNLITGTQYTLESRQTQQGFPKWVSPKDRKILMQGHTIKANVVVAKDGSGNYRTVSEAIDQTPSGGRFVIHVKAGIYKEKIHTNKDGITLIGDGKYSTIVTGDDSASNGASLRDSATFTVTGDGFIARDIGFSNTAGPKGQQAIALNIASDHSVLYNCSISGYQDTLYALALREFYRECDIYGTIDFIFGNAAAVFQSCNLPLRKPNSGSYNVILANGRSDPRQNTGFSVQNCKITANSDLVKHSSYLGRPWKEYSRSVVMQSIIDDVISPSGWVQWSGARSSVLKTLYYAEYENKGLGAEITKRVNWPGFHVIGAEEAVRFTVANFISGTSWLPTTGVNFVPGLS